MYNNGKGNNIVRIYNLCGCRSKLDSVLYHCIILLNSKSINKSILCDSVHCGMYSSSLGLWRWLCTLLGRWGGVYNLHHVAFTFDNMDTIK